MILSILNNGKEQSSKDLNMQIKEGNAVIKKVAQK